jgi:DNA-binding transcriptional MerR regulator
MHKLAKSNARKPVAGEVVIPDKLYFRIGEVSRLLSLPSYVLRFWETEFPQLKPSKSSTGQRMYRKVDVEHALEIKKLLYEQGFTIAGARQQLRAEAKRKQNPLPLPASAPAAGRVELKQVRQGLRDILGILGGRRPAGQ